jgi:anti-sigma factor RsiW
MKRPLDSELNELVDGRLAPQRAAEVQEWLAEHPDEAAKVHAWKKQKEALHAAFDKILDEPLPSHLNGSAMPGSRWHRQLPRMIGSAGWLAAGIAIGFFARDSSVVTSRTELAASLPHQAAVAHVIYSPEVRHPVEVGADQEAHLVQWLSKRLGASLVIPSLNAQGFSLVGGRLLPSDKGPAAQFMYQDKAGVRLTLYVRHDAGNAETAFRFAEEGSLSVFYWVDGPFGYALSGEVPRDKLLNLAEASYRQLGRNK